MRTVITAAVLVAVTVLAINAMHARAQDSGLIAAGQNPSDLRPSTHMPMLELSNDDIKAIAAFLASRQ